MPVREREPFQIADAVLKIERGGETVDAGCAEPDVFPGEGGFDKEAARIGEVAAETHLQRRRGGFGTHFFQLAQEAFRKGGALPRVLLRCGCRRLKRLRVDEPARGRDAHAAEQRLGLREINLMRGQQQAGVDARDFEFRTLPVARIQGQREARVAQVDRVDERFAVDEIAVVDVEHDAVDRGEHPARILCVLDHHVARDQPREWIEREPLEGNLHAPLAELVDDVALPFPGEAEVVGIPAAPDHAREHQQKTDSNSPAAEPSHDVWRIESSDQCAKAFRNPGQRVRLWQTQMASKKSRFVPGHRVGTAFQAVRRRGSSPVRKNSPPASDALERRPYPRGMTF